VFSTPQKVGESLFGDTVLSYGGCEQSTYKFRFLYNILLPYHFFCQGVKSRQGEVYITKRGIGGFVTLLQPTLPSFPLILLPLNYDLVGVVIDWLRVLVATTTPKLW